jgi:hypothetical protein
MAPDRLFDYSFNSLVDQGLFQHGWLCQFFSPLFYLFCIEQSFFFKIDTCMFILGADNAPYIALFYK